MKKIITLSFVCFLTLLLGGCYVAPSLTYDYKPDPRMSKNLTPVKKIIVMNPTDTRPHLGTSPRYDALIPFTWYVQEVNEPETFIYKWNGTRFDYLANFSELVAMDLQSAGVANEVVTSPDVTNIPTLITGKNSPDYIISLMINRMDWQDDYSLYGVSVLGYIPQIFGYPSSFGYSYLSFTAEVLNADGEPIAKKTFSAEVHQDGWIYYYSGYLRALTEAYAKISPSFRVFVENAITRN